MKKILILYTALGAGHEQVARYIGEYLTETYKEQVEIKIFDSIAYANSFWFKLHKFAFIYNFNLVGVSRRKKIYQQIEERTSILTNYDNLLIRMFTNKKIETYIKNYQPDYIVSTMFGNSNVVSKMKEKGIVDVPLMTVITDMDAHFWWIRHPEQTNYYVVSNEEMKNHMIEQGIPCEKILSYGIPIAKKFNPNLDIISLKQTYQIDKEKFIILVFGGGGYGFNTILPYYQKVLELGDSVTSIFIAGKNEHLRKKASKLSSKYQQQSFVFGFVDQINELMAISNVIVTKPGGITVTEAITMNKPMILVTSIGGQEDANLNYVVKHQCGLSCDTLELFEETLNHMKEDSQILESLNDNLKKTAKENSIDRVCKVLMKTR